MNAIPSKLGDAIEILSGFAFKAERFNDTDGLPVIRIRDVLRGYSETRYAGEVDESFIVQNGETIIGMDGNFNAARWKGGPALLNQRVCKVTAREKVLDDGFLFHLLPRALKKIEDETPFVTVKHLSVKGLRDIHVVLPPLPEQRRIAAILDQADALRAKRREALAQLDSLAQSIFIEMFGDPVANQKAWPNPTLGGALCFQQYGPRFYNESYNQDGVRIVRITDLDEAGNLDFSSMPRLDVSEQDRTKYQLRPGDLIFARTGATVGKVALVASDAPPCIAGAYFITMRFEATVDPVYVRAVLTAPTVRALIARRSRQAAQQNFSGPALRQLPLPLPPLRLQRDFASRVKAIAKLKDAQAAALAELNTLFASLQHRAFAGQL